MPTISTRLWIPLAAALIAFVALVDVRIAGPRVGVRWRADISEAERAARERGYSLRNGEQDKDSPSTWRYELGDRSRENLRSLVTDPAAADTAYIDRERLTDEGRRLSVAIRGVPPLPGLPFPFSSTDEFMDPWRLFQIQSAWLLLAVGVMLRMAHSAATRHRRNVTVGILLLVGVMACLFPISPSTVRMSDALQNVANRGRFSEYAGVNQIRFEAHLTYAILGQLDRVFGRTDETPRRAQTAVARGATAWFVLSALAIGFIEGWSPFILRYLGLALLAPCALLYFGWREFGYLSLNVAAFPLLARGLRDGGNHVEAGSVLGGLGAALHGWGLVSLGGMLMAALAAPSAGPERVGRALRVAAWGTAAYLGWCAIYVIILKLPITLGHAEAIPWRPWFADEVFDGRLNVAIFSAAGARDLFMTAWVVGAPLLVIAVSLWRKYPNEVRTTLACALPSVICVTLIWHTQGLKEDMDVVFGIFPAIHALAWICAHDPTRTKIAAALLVSAHLAFWRIVLDTQFAAIVVR